MAPAGLTMNPYRNTIARFIYYSGVGSLAGMFRTRPACSILVYHRVCPYEDQESFLPKLFTDVSLFEEQLKFLKQRYAVLSLEELIDKLIKKEDLPQESAVITFDDGYEDNYRFAFPVLKKLRLPSTLFVPTAFIGTRRFFWWDQISFLLQHTKQQKIFFRHKEKEFHFSLSNLKEKKNFFSGLSSLIKLCTATEEEELLKVVRDRLDVFEEPQAARLLDWEQLKEMQGEGVEIGAHTDTHRAVASVSDGNFYPELCSSKEILERNLGREVDFFAYPYGEQQHINDNSGLIQKAGYKAGLTTRQGLVSKGDDLFLLPRIGIGGNDSKEVFKLKVAGVWHRLVEGRRLWRLR